MLAMIGVLSFVLGALVGGSVALATMGEQVATWREYVHRADAVVAVHRARAEQLSRELEVHQRDALHQWNAVRDEEAGCPATPSQ